MWRVGALMHRLHVEEFQSRMIKKRKKSEKKESLYCEQCSDANAVTCSEVQLASVDF